MRPYLTFFFSLLSLTACAIAQLPAAKTEPCEKIAAGMAFDVVSIHLANPDPTNYSYGIGGGGDHLTASNAPLSVLLQFATSLPKDQIVGLTGTQADAHFNIEAKLLPAEDGAPPKYTDRQLQCMVMPMLADRFHLVTHTETRVKPVFELMTAKGGPKLTPAPDSATDGSLTPTSAIPPGYSPRRARPWPTSPPRYPRPAIAPSSTRPACPDASPSP